MDESMTWDEFYSKMDWEGSAVEVLRWGGAGVFPVEAQDAAEALEAALANLETIVEENAPLAPFDMACND